MRGNWNGWRIGTLIAAIVTLSGTALSTHADARSSRSPGGHATAHASRFLYSTHSGFRGSRPRYARHFGGGFAALQCVPFARENSGIELSGNAGTWWDSADGIYARGANPEVGSILAFRSTARMRYGHVAVVTNVIDSRHIEIDHANWSGPGRISRDIDVVDVSPDNDWSAVRVALAAETDTFGSTYPTYGFIYDRPDNGVMVASHQHTAAPVQVAGSLAPQPSLESVGSAAATMQPEEVAEALDDLPSARSTRHRSFAKGLVSRRVATHSARSVPHASRVTAAATRPMHRHHS